MKKILVHLESGRLCDIVDGGSEFSVSPGLQWFDAPDNVSPETHKFSNGVVVAKPPKPLPQVKAEKLNELRQAREAASVANVTVQGKVFSAESNIQTAFKRLAERMRRGKPTKLQAIMDVDGNPITQVTQALLDGIEDAIADNTENVWNKYVTLAAQVQAATTVEQVVAVTW